MVPQNGSEVDPARGADASAGGDAADVQHRLQVMLPAQPATAALVRERVRAWLAAAHWPAADRDDVIAAVSEAVENVISHAYDPRRPGDVEVTGGVERASRGMRQAVLAISDQGRWRPPVSRSSDRGRGFTIMRACMDSVRAVLSDHGTRLEMRSRPVPRV